MGVRGITVGGYIGRLQRLPQDAIVLLPAETSGYFPAQGPDTVRVQCSQKPSQHMDLGDFFDSDVGVTAVVLK